jgi:capsular exopolysaccharide synthesis family protein
MEPLHTTPNESGEGINIQEQVLKYLKHWKWILLSVIVCTVAANVYVRYLTPQYGMSTTILIKDDKKSGSALDAFSDLGIITGGKNNIENEIAILQSRTLSQNIIKELEFNISYFVEGRIISSESYKQVPIKILFIDKSNSFFVKDTSFVVRPVSEKVFEMSNELNQNPRRFVFGSKIKSSIGTFVVLKNDIRIGDGEIVIRISSVEQKAAEYSGKLQVEPVGKKTSILKLSMSDVIPEKGIDYLKALVEQYNIDAADDKNLIAKNTFNFIENRLGIITNELDSVEKGAETFKKQNRLTTLSADASLSLSSSAGYEKSLVENETDLKVVDYMISIVVKASNNDLIPNNIMSSGGALISEYNKIVLDRSRVLKTASPSNPYIVNADQQLAGIKANILESLRNERSSLKIAQRDLSTQENIYGGKIGEVPTHERQYRIIERQQQIKESLYLYLLQKREETAISLAVTSPKAKVIDVAYSTGIVAPNKKMILLVAFGLGLLLPIGIILLLDLMDNKIHSRQDIENLTTVPYLGEIPLTDENKHAVSFDSRSNTAESFRIVLANLEFMLAQSPTDVAKTVFVTSTLPMEGKTFASVNLARTLALYGKKVILVGMDLRHPKFAEYFDIDHRTGLSNYLSSDKYKPEDVIFKQEGFKDFAVMPSGVIPPNPAELLNSTKARDLFSKLEQTYDYIIADTAPVSLVTDTLLLKDFADVFVYVVRANYLRKDSLAVPQALHRENRLPNMSILLNGVDQRNAYGYGYGYGYGYRYGKEDEKKSWVAKFFEKKG